MNVVRFRRAEGGAAEIGVVGQDGVRPLAGHETLASLLTLRAEALQERLSAPPTGAAMALDSLALLAPIDGRTEVWASGVTYEISREARVEESERAADIYRLVYDAERPELFFKAVSWKVHGPGAPVAVRADSPVNVPEPELAVVCNAHGEIVGYSVCNDCSSRSIEGENPLYLPQAKVYAGSCTLGPWIRPAWEIADPYNLSIELTIERGGEIAFSGTANTSRLHRRLDELVAYLYRADRFGEGAVLSTGTCLVPEAPFTLLEGDLVTITIGEIGTLSNRVVEGMPAPIG